MYMYMFGCGVMLNIKCYVRNRNGDLHPFQITYDIRFLSDKQLHHAC